VNELLGINLGQVPELLMIEIIGATRLSEGDFWNRSALGISLRRLRFDRRLVVRLAFANQRGLPDIYNARITTGDSNDLLVFIHDDVWIDDYFLADRVIEGLRTYDVIGVVGNRRKAKNQTAWAFLDTTGTWDERANLTGSIAHGKYPFGPISFFGAVPADCELLDGVFLAAKKSVLLANGVLFDPRFEFNFYDMDFCRSARQRGLRLGTWPICLTHQSKGAFGSKQWNEKYRAYIEKWGD
jgi:GT2 family glycosyltransferase